MLSPDLTLVASVTIVSFMFVSLRLTGALIQQNRELCELLRDRENQKYIR